MSFCPPGDARFTNPDMMLLAGNAMSGFVLAGLFTGIFAEADFRGCSDPAGLLLGGTHGMDVLAEASPQQSDALPDEAGSQSDAPLSDGALSGERFRPPADGMDRMDLESSLETLSSGGVSD